MNEVNIEHLYNMEKMLSVASALSMELHIVTLGHKLGKDPKELLDGFVKSYERYEPHMEFYYHVGNYGLFVLYRVELLARAMQKIPSFSGSPSDIALSNLLEAFREYKKLSDNYFNFQYIEKFGPFDPSADLIMEKIKLDIPMTIHRISELEKQLESERDTNYHLRQMVKYREEKLQELGVEV